MTEPTATHSLPADFHAMAAIPFDECQQNIKGILDGSCSPPVSCPCIKLLEPSFDEISQHCSIDILPILLERPSFPERLNCPFHSSHGQDVYSISVLSNEGNDPQCASELAFLSFLEVANPSNDQMCLDAQLNCQNCIDFQMKSADAIPPCIVDINIGKESSKTPKSTDETVESLKSEGVLTRVLWRQASLKIGGKIVQLLTNTSRDKSGNERTYDTSNNRWRKYKRATSFDSRKIVLLFSILSSLGTLVLIYLTLRVRQNGDAYARV
ncbi:uncharacterized protein LOC122303623 isoform X2 [Carya illinoinensis]|uniref:Uncharacterized protein n=1 Tax=Carya illinoinensis TaxID=32201 RepID=A0A8T1R4A3_CARIL|nr:uncharacterized protein LOC122303623 isoform X2 [Carya illinoinensis]KAG6660971.1 hypothetical protein CIPAW_03G142200 [Carya illinoinensis]